MNPMSCFISALKGSRSAVTPVWFMRQAGRSLPEYRKIRGNMPMLEACLTPELAGEITAQPVRRHGVDAAVFFSDIVVPIRLADVDITITPGVGPTLPHGYDTPQAVEELISRQITDTDPVTQGVRCAAEKVSVPVLAFAGAPFTLAAYLIEGRPTRDHLGARILMHADPKLFSRLLNWCAEMSIAFIRAQVKGGAEAYQLFDSWAGVLSAEDYRRHCLPATQKILCTDFSVPSIHFGVGTQHLLPAMAQNADCLGIDFKTPLSQAVALLREKYASPGAQGRKKPVVVQGNIDPAMLMCPPKILRPHLDSVLAAGRKADAHIVNLGHGVPKNTDPDVLTKIVEYVHSQKTGEND